MPIIYEHISLETTERTKKQPKQWNFRYETGIRYCYKGKTCIFVFGMNTTSLKGKCIHLCQGQKWQFSKLTANGWKSARTKIRNKKLTRSRAREIDPWWQDKMK